MNVQEIIVLLIAACALAYLGYRFIFKKKSHDCDKCGFDNPKKTNKH
ncbi:MAG: FeoB-associated Cys-rich membrane protein [Flavobacteriales bacterium CG_4_10_14_0_2_um_filter_32_8]|nr:MAG: FeoB-associated Cys-rich membrane protein [Flavobacteriales bacterium CG_4_10_14_0_2_um_filter_32_8]PJB15594.1 MAG: FeoB-associated Cys-rich membrane protein [Flavobacteriales bacterium CG_4_9_14_3_um_filter_32_8]